jgi:hypothetical protein
MAKGEPMNPKCIGNKKGLIVVSIIAVFIIGAIVSYAEEPSLSVAIEWNPENPKGEGAFWLLYLSTRALYIEKHSSLYEKKEGPITPTFDEECEARKVVVESYRQIKESDKELNVPYFNDLDRIEKAGYLREYVWTYFYQFNWKKKPEDLKLEAFDKWRLVELKDHEAITKGRVTYVTSGKK